MRSLFAAGLMMAFVGSVAGQTRLVDFEDLNLPGPNSFYNGSDGAGVFTSVTAAFNNNYSALFDAWTGFAYSNVRDVTTQGFENQYAAYHVPGGGSGMAGSDKYGLAFNYLLADAVVTLPGGFRPQSMFVTNTTYTALTMANGDPFSKRFGGTTGDDPDFFRLTIEGIDANNSVTGSVLFYLADYQFSNNTQDYIISQWTSVDLSALSDSTVKLRFGLESTDVGMFGMNTPAYFAMDNLLLASVPEVGTWVMFGVVGAGVGGLVWWRRRRVEVAMGSPLAE